MEFFLNRAELSLNSVYLANSGNLITKALIRLNLKTLSLTGTVLASWYYTQEVAVVSPFTVMTNIFEKLRKTPLRHPSVVNKQRSPLGNAGSGSVLINTTRLPEIILIKTFLPKKLNYQTNPTGLFMHGFYTTSVSLQIIWRSDLFVLDTLSDCYQIAVSDKRISQNRFKFCLTLQGIDRMENTFLIRVRNLDFHKLDEIGQ